MCSIYIVEVLKNMNTLRFIIFLDWALLTLGTCRELQLPLPVTEATGESTLSSLAEGIEQLMQDRRTLKERDNTIKTQQAQQLESEMAIKDLKEALKHSRDELKAANEEINRLKTREEKEGDAIFNSLTSKISERNDQIEAANTRNRNMERELRRKEAQAAKEIRKEQARAAAAEKALEEKKEELATTKADLEAVEDNQTALKQKLENFKKKQREFIQKAQMQKEELTGCKAALSSSRVTPEMIDAFIAKAIGETETSKEREFEERTADMAKKVRNNSF